MARELNYTIAQDICFVQIIQHSFASAVISNIFSRGLIITVINFVNLLEKLFQLNLQCQISKT